MTLVECVESMSARLASAGVSFGHGTTCAFDEAAWLVLWRLGIAPDQWDEVAARVLSPAEQATCTQIIDERIARRLPAAYLTGEAWLQGVPFTVDPRTIVPRSLIAELIADGTLEAWLAAPPRRVLDLCTGGASLAVLAALAWQGAAIDASDASADALAVAAINVARHGLAQRITLHCGDALAAVAGRRYDLILCNPPYVNRAAMAALPAEYRAEPAIALDGGDDGMDFVRPLLAAAADALAPRGMLVLEIGHERTHFELAFPQLEPYWLPTSAGDDLVLLLERDMLAALR